MVYIVDNVNPVQQCLIVDIDELVLFKVFNCGYRRTCTVQRVDMVYIVDRVLFNSV